MRKLDAEKTGEYIKRKAKKPKTTAWREKF